MAKQGMKRPEFEHRKNEVPPVPELGGKARSGKEKAPPMVAGGMGRVWHEAPPYESNDLAIENLREDFDLSDTDVQDLEQ